MKEGKLGHIYPQIDESLCINCGACARVCPQNEAPAFSMPLSCYAAHNKNDEEHKTSTSGGIAALLSRKVLSSGGIVYGCSSKTENGINHIRCESEQDLSLLKGSKYVQSNINGSLALAKRDLENGKTVLFFGSPCQIAGLKKYLNRDYENLIAVDLLCHGVPSQKMLFEHIGDSAKSSALISFRESAGYFLNVSVDGENVFRKPSAEDSYYSCFFGNLTLRDSCHDCSFAKVERCSDITIGDFWGLGKDSTLHNKNGVSVVLPISDKGLALFESIKPELKFEERTISEAVAGNHPLRTPAAEGKKRDLFISVYEKHGFEKAAKRALRSVSILPKIKKTIKTLLRK